MGGRSRIRWHKVAKLALAGFGCLALFTGLPSLIRRPEPPPLEPDIGLAPLAASRAPAPSGLQPGRAPERRTAKGADPHRRRAHDRRRPGSPRPARGEEPHATATPVTAVAAAAPAPMPGPAPVPRTPAAPPPAPPAPPPAAAPPARPPASGPATASEFGFER